MGALETLNALRKRLKNNNDGNMALTMALSSAVIISVAGAAMDFSVATNATSKTQHLADSSALTAAIYVKENNGAIPSSKEEGLIGDYSAKELGFIYSDFVKGGSEGVNVNVSYDREKQEVNVKVRGETTPLFAQMMGKNSIPFSANSKVFYQNKYISNPVSVFMVLDNSNSMAIDDLPDRHADTVSRISGLQSSLTAFRTELQNIVDESAEGSTRLVRSAIATYDEDLGTVRVNPKWGLYNQSVVDTMHTKLAWGTNSSIAMDLARQWMVSEDTVHNQENPDVDAKKFVIFMTDGANQERAQTCIDMKVDHHQHWLNRNNGNIRHKVPNNSNNWDYVWAHPENTADEDRIECLRPSRFDIPTIEDCNTLKAMPNTEVFTIGYGLEPGRYYKKNSPNHDGSNVSYEASIKAYHLLRSCASSPDHFFKAKDAESLLSEFQNIGSKIAESTIRIAQ